MTPNTLLIALASRGIAVTTDGEDLLIEARAEPDPATLELLKKNKSEIIRYLIEKDTLPQLPWQLARLVRAADANSLNCKIPRVFNINRYTLSWAVAYLTGNRSTLR